MDHLTDSYDHQSRPDLKNHYILDLEANKPNTKINSIYEISIPTCSYRMGVPEMGYGMLTISKYVTIFFN